MQRLIDNQNMKFSKKRSSNFTYEEKKLLVDFVKENVAIIENKSVDTKLLKQKSNCWKRCAQKFLENGYNRDASKLKDTYHRMKHHAKVTIKKYKQRISAAKFRNGQIHIDPPTDIDYAIMNMCPVDFKVARDSPESYHNGQGVTVLKSEPIFTANASPKASPEHTEDEMYVDEPEIILESTADILQTDILDSDHNVLFHSPTRFDNDKPPSKSEEAQTKYYLMKMKHESEIHGIRIKNLQADEKRKAELHERALEEHNLKLLLLKKQLNDF